MTNEAEEVNEIREIITWYQGLPEDYLGLNELMNKRQKLSAATFFFATSVGEASKAWNMAHAMAETKKNQLRVEFGSNTSADYKARANNGDLYEAEKMAEGLYWAMREELGAIKEVLSSMSQQIAWLRDELTYNRHIR